MQRWRGLAVLACVVLGMSGAARADWLAYSTADNARGDPRAPTNICNAPSAQRSCGGKQVFILSL